MNELGKREIDFGDCTEIKTLTGYPALRVLIESCNVPQSLREAIELRYKPEDVTVSTGVLDEEKISEVAQLLDSELNIGVEGGEVVSYRERVVEKKGLLYRETFGDWEIMLYTTNPDGKINGNVAYCPGSPDNLAIAHDTIESLGKESKSIIAKKTEREREYRFGRIGKLLFDATGSEMFLTGESERCSIDVLEVNRDKTVITDWKEAQYIEWWQNQEIGGDDTP